MENNETKTTPQRLCSEIQLFDLCELERCTYKDGRFCTDPRLLEKFEAIADEEDERPAPDRRAADVDGADDEDGYYDDGQDEDEDEDGYSVFDDEDGEEQDWER